MNNQGREWLLPASPCWIFYPPLYECAPAVVVTQLDKQTVEVQLANNHRIKVSIDHVEQRSNRQSYDEQHDLVGMDVLNEAEIFTALRSRYLQGRQIYTLMGQTLIAVNPYHHLEIYGDGFIRKYRNLPRTSDKGVPHVYEIARQAEGSLKEDLRSQAILITGESGAGKTETLKYLVEYLCYYSERQSPDINEKIIACNPIMEAFGNAATSRNSNSSRFGKFIKLYYILHNKEMKLVGAYIENYLLEKTRVIGQASGESNFHIFKMLAVGTSTQQKYRYRLNALDLVRYKGTQEEGDQRFDELLRLFEQVGFTNNEINTIISIVAAIMNLNALYFTKVSDEKCKVANQSLLRNFTELLGANYEQVYELLLNKKLTVGKSSISSPLKLYECHKVRGGLCKNLYEALFDYIVERLNGTLNPTRDQQTNQYTLGLLDIFGFESFQFNGLEQLFINYTNERLQQIYVHYVFKSVQYDMLAEHVELDNFSYSDNSPLLSLLDQPPLGLFEVLQDSCSLANDDDYSFLNKLRKAYPKDYRITFDRKSKALELTVSHTASPVTYNVLGFRSKNMDIRKLDLSTTDKVVAAVLHSKTTQPIGSKFVSAALRKYLKNLTDNELLSCNLFFIRCIKPNQIRAAFQFDNRFVTEQIRYLGILEAVRVRKQGYSEKMTFGYFVAKYGFLVGVSKKNDRQVIEQIEAKLQKKFQKGSHKLFLKAEQSQQLKSLFLAEHERKIRLINRIQQAYIGYKQRRTLKQRVARLAGLAKLSRCFDRISAHHSKLRGLYLIKLRAAEQKARKVSKPAPAVLKQSLKENLENDKQVPSTLHPPAEELKPFKKQYSASMRIAAQNVFVYPVTHRPHQTYEPATNLPTYLDTLAQSTTSNNEPPLKLQLEPQKLCAELHPKHYCFVQPDTPISTGTPNKDFHSAILEQQLLNSQKFESYCRYNLYFKYPKDIGGQLEKLLSYRNKNLSHAMLKYSEEFLKDESDFAFRCLLKIVGERKSRYSQLDNLNHLASLMMGLYNNKETGLQHNIIESVRHKKQVCETSRSSFWSASQYNSTMINNIEESIQRKPVNTRQTVINQYEALKDSPLTFMRDEIYLQFSRQFGGNSDPIKLRLLKEGLYVLTRYFSPSPTLIQPYIHFIQEQKVLKESTIRNNLLRFAEYYTVMEAFCDAYESNQLKKATEAMDFLSTRKSYLGRFELYGKLSLSVLVYDKATVTLTFSNETLGSVRRSLIQRLGLTELEDNYSLWHRLEGYSTEQGQFVSESMKVVDYVNASLKQIDYQMMLGKKESTFSLNLRLKYCFPFTKSQPSLTNLVYCQICQEFKYGRFDLSLEEEASLASIVLYLQRGGYTKDGFRRQWLCQFRGISYDLSMLIEKAYTEFSPVNDDLVNLQLNFLSTILQANPHLFLSHEFPVTFFEVERFEGSFKKSAIGLPMLMTIKPTYILLIDCYRKKSYDRIELSMIDKWGLSKGKTTCLIVQTTKQELKIFASDHIHTVEEIISEYISRLAGQKQMLPTESMMIREQ